MVLAVGVLRRRRHRRRQTHLRESLAAKGGDGADIGRHHRHHAGADGGVGGTDIVPRLGKSIIYRQFSVTMVAAGFSAFLALSLTPALCARISKPVAGHRHAKSGGGAEFNRMLEGGEGYSRTVGFSVTDTGACWLVSPGPWSSLPGGSCRSTTRASSPPTCRRRRTRCIPAPRGRASRRSRNISPAAGCVASSSPASALSPGHEHRAARH